MVNMNDRVNRRILVVSCIPRKEWTILFSQCTEKQNIMRMKARDQQISKTIYLANSRIELLKAFLDLRDFVMPIVGQQKQIHSCS